MSYGSDVGNEVEPSKEAKHIRNALFDAFNLIQNRCELIHAHDQNVDGLLGLKTGFQSLDAATNGGLQPGHLIVFGGRPAMGTSTLAMNIAVHVASKEKRSVGMFSLDMSASKLAIRMAAYTGRIHAARLRSGDLKDEDLRRLVLAIKDLRDLPIVIDDSRLLSINELCDRARQMHDERGGLGLIVVDSLREIINLGADSSVATARALKNLAVELDVPVMVLSPVHRRVDKRRNNRPYFSDLCDAHIWRAMADVIVLLYREAYYTCDSQVQDAAEILVGGRSCHGGDGKLKFLGDYYRFEEVPEDFPLY